MNEDIRTRTWYCTMRNPSDYGFNGEPKDIMNYIVNRWMTKEYKIACVAYCIYPDDTELYLIVLHSEKYMRLSALKKRFPQMFETVEGASKWECRRFLMGDKSCTHKYITEKYYLLTSRVGYDHTMHLRYEEIVYS